MTCQICEIHERDLQDLSRELRKRRIVQTSAFAGKDWDDLALEISAISAAKADIEAKYSKHRNSASH